MTNKELFGKITRIAQGNIQEVVKPMLKRIIALEEAMDAKSTAPEVVHGPDDHTLSNDCECDPVVEDYSNGTTPDDGEDYSPIDPVVEETELELETLIVENDYVQQNLKEEEVE